MNDTARLETLRAAALRHSDSMEAFLLNFYKSYPGGDADFDAYGEAFYAALDALRPHIGEGELIVGETVYDLSAEEEREWKDVYCAAWRSGCQAAGDGQDSHMAIDYDAVLREGLSGIIARIDGCLQTCGERQRAFYRCARRCLEAVIQHSRHYAEYAEALAGEVSDPQRRGELLELAAVCRRVPANPARSFYEALQSAHFVTYCLGMNPFRPGQQQFQLGRPDRYLLPYYEHGVAAGTLTPERAQLLFDCLAVQINMRVPNGLSSGYMVGGRDSAGNIVANALTLMGMQAIDDVRLVYPAVGFCHTAGMPDEYLEKACEILTHGRSHPAIFNDDVIAQGLAEYGADDPRNYIHSTCVEITPIAASNVWVASPYTNMPQLLLDCMSEPLESHDALMAALFERLDASIRRNFEEQNAFRAHRAAHSMNPLLSCFVGDCLERGEDIERGGARYNWIMPSFVGMANLVDSLYAVKELVYSQRRLTLAEFKRILDADFVGHEALRREILETIPKYGNDCDEIDGMFTQLVEHIVAECRKYTPMLPNGRLIPSVFCWIMHERFGVMTGATPDGRSARFPLGDGSGPCQGREKKGPTASILSSTKWSHKELIGGVAVNMKFLKSSLGAQSVDTLMVLVRTYLLRGGFEIQINVVDQETLQNARRRPEAYQDLVVRIGGYSDYFVRLSPEMQEEVILRTAHSL